MTQQVTVVITDDLDGSIATHAPAMVTAETVRFAIDGEAYEIHLGEANAARLRAVYALFIAHGRRRGAVPRPARLRVLTACSATCVPAPGVRWAGRSGSGAVDCVSAPTAP